MKAVMAGSDVECADDERESGEKAAGIAGGAAAPTQQLGQAPHLP
jgi:hypothetical protein